MRKNYPGQKNLQGVYQKIINHIPEYSAYYELFGGTAAIARLLPDNAPRTVYERSTKVYSDMAAAHQGSNIKWVNGDAFAFFHHYADNSNDFIFLDPPYLHSTRPHCTNLYQYELSDEQHIHLLESVKLFRSKIMLIHPKCELYDTMLADWYKVEIKLRYHNKTSVECLYMNYPTPAKLHLDHYLGKNRTDRQRIKRKCERIVKKFKELPPQEMDYILTRLNLMSI